MLLRSMECISTMEGMLAKGTTRGDMMVWDRYPLMGPRDVEDRCLLPRPGTKSGGTMVWDRYPQMEPLGMEERYLQLRPCRRLPRSVRVDLRRGRSAATE